MQILEYSLIGIASGGLYVLAALGFVIIFKASNIFNFAMGEMMMFGAYLFFAMTVQLHFGWPVAVLVALRARSCSRSRSTACCCSRCSASR